MGLVISILKILGMILLVILAVLLLLLLVILFIPVRYRAKGEIPAEGRPHGMVKATWFFHSVSFRLEYDSGKYKDILHWELRILGILFRFRQKVRPPEKSQEEETEKEKESKENTVSDRKQQPDKSGEASVEKPEEEKKQFGNSLEQTEPTEKDRKPEEEGTARQEKKKEQGSFSEKYNFFNRLYRKIYAFFITLKKTFQNIRYTITRLCDKIKRILNNLEYYKDVLTREENLLVIGKVKGQTGRLLRHVRPQKADVNFIVGTGDPASTAQILAVHGILYPVIGETVHISPDFDDIRLEGDFNIRGRVRIAVVLDVVLRIILDKKTWRFIRQLKKEEMTNGR